MSVSKSIYFTMSFSLCLFFHKDIFQNEGLFDTRKLLVLTINITGIVMTLYLHLSPSEWLVITARTVGQRRKKSVVMNGKKLRKRKVPDY